MSYTRVHPNTTWRSPGRPDLSGINAVAAPVAGAARVGSVAYDVPDGALFVATTGNDTNPGTSTSPKATLAAAISAAPSGGVIVIRGGEYRQKPGDFGTKRLTVQSYPGEEVWFDGSDVVTGFTGSGPWVKTGWTTEFDHSTSYTTGDTGLRLIDPAYPLAAWPDMVFIDGVRQTLVSGTPGAGEFAVDYNANTLTIGTNPAGKTVRAAVRDWWGIIRANGTILRGIGIRRYATSLAGAQATLIVTSNATEGVTLEQLWLEDCGQQSISIRGHKTVVRQTTILRAGAVGIHATKAQDLRYDRLYVAEANYRRFKHEPISAAVKLSPDCHRAVIKDSVFYKSYSYGVWFDTDCFDITVTGCLAKDCATVGIYSEANDSVIFAGNYVEGNGNFGMTNLLSTRMKMWCNQADNHRHWDIGVSQDERRNTNPATMARAPWVVSDTEICNNVFTNRTGPSSKLFQAYTLDKATGRVAPLMVSALSGNLFSAHNPDGTTTRMFGWDTNGDNQVTGSEIYKTPAAFRTVTGWDNAVTTITDPTPQQVASFNTAANPLPADVAAALDVPAGTRLIGPPRPRPVVAAT